MWTGHKERLLSNFSLCIRIPWALSIQHFGNFTMERYIPVAQTRPKPPHVWLLFLYAGYKRAVLGTTILSNGKGHFGPTDRSDQTSQSVPPSKLIPKISVGPNRNGPFHLMYQPKFPEFWVEFRTRFKLKLKTSRPQ